MLYFETFHWFWAIITVFYEGGMGSISIWVRNTRWRFLEHYTWHFCVGEEGGKAASICVYGFMLYVIGKKRSERIKTICFQNSYINFKRIPTGETRLKVFQEFCCHLDVSASHWGSLWVSKKMLFVPSACYHNLLHVLNVIFPIRIFLVEKETASIPQEFQSEFHRRTKAAGFAYRVVFYLIFLPKYCL